MYLIPSRLACEKYYGLIWFDIGKGKMAWNMPFFSISPGWYQCEILSWVVPLNPYGSAQGHAFAGKPRNVEIDPVTQSGLILVY